jgi:hypothetical protein
MIKLKQLLFEQAETTTYQFKNSFADNIVIPVKANQPNITAFSKITNINQLDANLRDFVNTLNAAITSGILKSGVITITSEADGGSSATKNVPRGWTQAQVNFSYGNGATVSNQTLADRRAEGIEFVIRKFIKLPAQVTIQKSGKVGNKKSAAAVVPIATANVNTPREYTKSGKKEQFDPKSTNVFQPPAYTDTKMPVAKCNSNLNANGQRGNPIAYRSKIDATGKITINFNAYYIPDRLVVTRVKQGANQGEIIYDSGYVSVDPNEAQVTFGKSLTTLNSATPNGYNGKINTFTAKQIDLGTDNTVSHFVEIYAPLGPTMWNMSIKCDTKNNDNDSASSNNTGGWNPGTFNVDFHVKNSKWPNKWTPNKSLYFSVYAKKDDAAKGISKDDILAQGYFSNGKMLSGKVFVYNQDGIIQKVQRWQNGKYLDDQGQL